MPSVADHHDANVLLARQMQAFRQHLEREGVVVDMAPALPVDEQLARLQEAVLSALACRKPQAEITSPDPAHTPPAGWHDAVAGTTDDIWEQTFDAIPDLVAVLDSQQRILRVNRAMADWLGTTPEACIGLRCCDVIHDSPEVRDLCPFVNAGDQQQPFAVQTHVADLLGATFQVSITPRYDAQGRLVGAVHVAHDISNRVRAEEERRALQAEIQQQMVALAVHESESRFRTLVEASPDAITQTDLEGRIVACNARALTMHGYTQPEEIIGRAAFELIVPEERALAGVNMQRVLTTGATEHLRYTLLRQDGSRFPGELSVGVIRDADGQPSGFVAVSRDVSDREQAEAALQESEARYRQLYQAVTDALFVHEIHPDGSLGPFIEVNDVAARRLGYTREELLHMSPTDIDVKGTLSHPGARGRRMLPDGDMIFEEVHRAKDGRQIPVEIHAHSFTWQGRQVVMSLARDITLRKQAQRASQVNRARFRALFENNQDGILLTHPDGRIISANPAACSILGRTEGEIIQVGYDGLLEADMLRETAFLACEQCGHYAGELTCIRKDGSRFPVEANAFAVDEPGKHGFAFLIFHEITARKQVEEALARERAFLDAAIELMPLPLFFMDRDLRLIRVNARMRSVMQEYGIASIWQVQMRDPFTRQPVPQDRKLTTRALRGEVVMGEECLLTASVTERELPCLGYAAPIFIDDEIAAIVFAIQDISVLKEADRAKDEFLATLSHELQTPLTAMLGWSDLALERGDPDFTRVAMDVVHRNACRQRVLIADMLDISRLVHRKLEIEPVLVDLGEQVRMAVENIQHQAESQKLALTVAGIGRPLPVLADPVRLQQCLGNVLHNSLKFTPSGGRISVSCAVEGAMARVDIQDTGRGVAPEMLRAIFTPFHQVDRDECAGGLGLGLAVTRGLVELHGGQIWATSPGAGQGCTITMTLPLCPVGTSA